MSFLNKFRVIIIGNGIGLLYWVLDSAIMAFIFDGGNFAIQMFEPSPQDTIRRVLVFVLAAILSGFAQILLRKRSKDDEMLKEEDDRFRQLVELSPDAVGIQSEDQIIYMNSAGLDLFGASDLNDLIGKSVWDFVPADVKGIVLSRFKQMREEGKEAPLVELELLRLDGKKVDVEVTAIPFSYAGKPAIQAIFRDLTSRKRVEKEIRQRNVELAALNAIASTVSQSLN
jgi:PAS domain S-box-containing protein